MVSSPARPHGRYYQHLHRHRDTWILVGWSVVLCVVVLAPLTAPGYVLSYDMVAVPDQALVPSALGISSALPRAVPLDAVVAIADTVVPGAVLQRCVLAGALVGAMVGAGFVLMRTHLAIRLVAATVYGWNAYVFERLVIGHWPILIAYAALPWLCVLGRRFRQGRRGAAAGGILVVGLASLTATAGLITSILFSTLVLVPGGVHTRRTRLAVALVVLGFQAAWLIPGLVRSDAAVSDPAGVTAFASRSDSPLGLIGSVATLGGIWNAGAVPDSRHVVSSAILTCALIALAGFGLRELPNRLGRVESRVLAVLAAGGLTLALVGAVPGGAGLTEWAVAHVPGGGLVRDGQKFLGWYALLLATAAATGVARIASKVANRTAAAALVLMAVGLPIAALPDLAWGAAGRLTPVEYPADWAAVRSVLRTAPPRGDLVVLPFQPFRSFPWANRRTVLDPAPRYLGIQTVVPDTLPVGGTAVPGEDPRAARVADALISRRPLDQLAALGIGWVAVERDTPGTVPDGILAGAEPVEINGTLDLYRIPSRPQPWTHVPPGTAVIAVDVVLLAILAAVSAHLVQIACLRISRAIRSPMP